VDMGGLRGTTSASALSRRGAGAPPDRGAAGQMREKGGTLANDHLCLDF
jgi:hypothetical protein